MANLNIVSLPGSVLTNISSFNSVATDIPFSKTCSKIYNSCRVMPGALAVAHRQFELAKHAVLQPAVYIPRRTFSYPQLCIFQQHFNNPTDKTARKAALALCSNESEVKAEYELEAERLFNDEYPRYETITTILDNVAIPESIPAEERQMMRVTIASTNAFIYQNSYINEDYMIFLRHTGSFLDLQTYLCIVDKYDKDTKKMSYFKALKIRNENVCAVIPPKKNADNSISPMLVFYVNGFDVYKDLNQKPETHRWQNANFKMNQNTKVEVLADTIYIHHLDGDAVLKIDRRNPEQEKTYSTHGKCAALRMTEHGFLKVPAQPGSNVCLLADLVPVPTPRVISRLATDYDVALFQNCHLQRSVGILGSSRENLTLTVLSLLSGERVSSQNLTGLIKKVKITDTALHAIQLAGTELQFVRFEIDPYFHPPGLSLKRDRTLKLPGPAAADA